MEGVLERVVWVAVADSVVVGVPDREKDPVGLLVHVPVGLQL